MFSFLFMLYCCQICRKLSNCTDFSLFRVAKVQNFAETVARVLSPITPTEIPQALSHSARQPACEQNDFVGERRYFAFYPKRTSFEKRAV
jgi:hypothetical protein